MIHKPLYTPFVFGIVSLAALLLMVACATVASPSMQEPEAPSAAEATQPAAPQPTQIPAIPEKRRLTLEWPATIRVKDSDVIRLTLEMDEDGNLTPTAQVEGNVTRGETVFIPNLYETHNVMAEARLDMAGVEATPEGEVSEPLLPGESVTFFWSVRPDEVGDLRGTIWVHLRFIPLDGRPEMRKPLSAQIVEIRAVNFLGLGGTAARLVGGLGTLLGSFLGLDNVLPWLFKRLKKSG